MDSWLVFRRDRVILNKRTKRDDWSFKRFSKTSFIWSLPIRQEILNVSQIGKAFHGICPPFFIQTWLQQYGRGAFFYAAHCSFSNPICLWSVWCWRTMIPGKVFPGLAKFQGIVNVNDFRLPIRLQELLQAPLRFLRSFSWHRYDCVHCVAKSCTTTAYRWLFRDSHPSLRTLSSALIQSPTFSALWRYGISLPPRIFWLGRQEAPVSWLELGRKCCHFFGIVLNNFLYCLLRPFNVASSAEFDFFCSACALILRGLQRILFPPAS